jgi:hypothetical protein
VDYEELRPLVLQALRQSETNQIIHIVNQTETIAREKGFYKDEKPYMYSPGGPEHYMPQEDKEKVRHIIWDLILQRVLIPGVSERNPGLPFIRVTDYGKECLESMEILPHDPDGYLKYLRQEIPEIDDTVVMYIQEGLGTFLTGNLLASTVMLGGASEKAVLLLMEAYVNAISDPNEKKRFEQSIERLGILGKFQKFRNRVDSIRRDIPRSISNDLDIQLDGIFNLIRNCRNDVGHPTGRKIDRRLAFSNLQLFIPYCKRIYNLIEYFNQASI